MSYGKAALVGSAGAMEHGGAMLHPKLGKPVRAAVGGGKSLMPSNVKVRRWPLPSICPSDTRMTRGPATISTRLPCGCRTCPVADEIVMRIAV